MKKRIIAFIVAVYVFTTCLLTQVCATESRVIDGEHLLTDEQEENLEILYAQIYSAYGIEVCFVTASDFDGKTSQSYADDLLDYDFAVESGVVLVISDNKREYAMSAVGEAEYIFNGSAYDMIEDEMLPYLSDGDYYTAFRVFSDVAEHCISYYYSNKPEASYDYDEFENRYDYNDSYYPEVHGDTVVTAVASNGEIAVFSLIAGIIISLIVVSCLKSQLKSVRMQAAASSYMRSGSMKLTKSTDRFLYRNITKVRRNTNNGSSGGSGRHISSSGRSHSGRSGRF